MRQSLGVKTEKIMELKRKYAGEIRLATVLGFPITIDPSWLIIVLLVTWTLAKGYFPGVQPELSFGLYLIMGFSGALLLFASVLIHELSHAYVAGRFGLRVQRITLFIFGGVSRLTTEPGSPLTEFWMAIAGPVMSFVLAFLFWTAGSLLIDPRSFPAMNAVVVYAAIVNLAVGVFNLVPGFPLDGGRVLRAALWHFMGDLQRATRIASAFGAGIAYLMMAVGVIRILSGDPIGGGWTILIGFFLRSASQSGYSQVLFRRYLESVRVGTVMRSDVVTLSPSMTLEAAVLDYFLRHSYQSFPVTSGKRLIGMISMEEIRRVPREEWPVRTVEEVMDREVVRVAARSSDSLLTVLQKMQREDRGRLPVVDKKEAIEGIISRHDILYQLQLRFELDR
jgi:Zn-dependent protease